MGPDISIDYTSILHKKLYKNVVAAGAGQKDQSGVKSGACTLYTEEPSSNYYSVRLAMMMLAPTELIN